MCVVAEWCGLWPSGVGCGRVMCVVAKWCGLWPSDVCCGRVVWVVAECCGQVVWVVAECCVLWPSGIAHMIGITFWEILLCSIVFPYLDTAMS